MNNKILFPAVTNAVFTIAYIVLVAWFMTSIVEGVLDNAGVEVNPVIGVSTMLSLLVLSVAVVGSLIFVRPVMWFMNGQKTEAVQLLAYTLGALLLGFLIIATILLVTAQGQA